MIPISSMRGGTRTGPVPRWASWPVGADSWHDPEQQVAASGGTRRAEQQMANGFTKAWKYLMALFSSKVDEYADPKVQIQQAIEDAQRQHQGLTQQAAQVIGNQRQLEMKLNRQMGEVEKLQGM